MRSCRAIILRREGDLDALGRHLLLELKDCNKEVLNDVDYLKKCLTETAEQIGATVVNTAFHQFSPYGVSGVVVVAESHLCIHTWPEYGYAAVDVFTCGDSIEPSHAVDILVKKLRSENPSYMELKRGLVEIENVSCGIKV
jgi:S-adenosylmethionine decarboxylase proenzyme